MKFKNARTAVAAVAFAALAVCLIAGVATGTWCGFGANDIAVLCPVGALLSMVAAKTLIPRAVLSIVVAIGATVLGGVIGILLGLISGYTGGVVDAVIMRIMDGMFAFPFILLSILLVTILGSGVFNVILAIGIGNVPRFARVVRSKVMVTKNEEFCNAERILGASSLRIMFSHILPNTVSEVVVYATLCVGSAIISEASLSFLGLGILIPTPSWGNILRGGRGCLTTAPHIATISGLLIFIAVIGFNLVGDGIRDVMDPKMKK